MQRLLHIVFRFNEGRNVDCHDLDACLYLLTVEDAVAGFEGVGSKVGKVDASVFLSRIIIKLEEAVSTAGKGVFNVGWAGPDLQRLHGCGVLAFEEMNEGPSVLVVNTGDVLEGHHDVVDVPAVHIQLQKLLDFGALKVILIRLVNNQVLVDIVSHKQSATRRRAEGRALAPTNALNVV